MSYQPKKKKGVVLSGLIYLNISAFKHHFLLKFPLSLVLVTFIYLSPAIPMDFFSIFPPIATHAIFIFSLGALPKIKLKDIFCVVFCLYLPLYHQGFKQCLQNLRCSEIFAK